MEENESVYFQTYGSEKRDSKPSCLFPVLWGDELWHRLWKYRAHKSL